MKKNIISYEDFVPNVYEDYSSVSDIVEDDPELQPAVALQHMLKNYGPAKVFSGYTAPGYSDDIPVTKYRPDLQTFSEDLKAHREEVLKSALTEAEKKNEVVDNNADVSAGSSASEKPTDSLENTSNPEG